MEELAEMNQRGITVTVSLDSMENVVKVDWRNEPVIERICSTYLQYKPHSHLLESNLVLIHSPLSKIHLFVYFLHKASIDSLFLALLDHGKKEKLLYTDIAQSTRENHNPQFRRLPTFTALICKQRVRWR